MITFKDTDLREALRRQYANAPTLPADFMERIMKRNIPNPAKVEDRNEQIIVKSTSCQTLKRSKNNESIEEIISNIWMRERFALSLSPGARASGLFTGHSVSYITLSLSDSRLEPRTRRLAVGRHTARLPLRPS